MGAVSGEETTRIGPALFGCICCAVVVHVHGAPCDAILELLYIWKDLRVCLVLDSILPSPEGRLQLLLDVVVGEGTSVLESRVREEQALLFRGHALHFLNLLLDTVYRLDLETDGSTRQKLHKERERGLKVKGPRLDVAPLTKVAVSNAERGPFFSSKLRLGHQSDRQLCVGQQLTILWLIATTILPLQPLYRMQTQSHLQKQVQGSTVDSYVLVRGHIYKE